jgi:D-alanyl-lipoteichoic acid acyltransferase DltB (MBOAT superfamily)
MNFIGLDFALFFGAVLILNWSLKSKQKAYPRFLLAANFIFYGLGAPKFLPLLLVVGLSNWLTCLGFDRCTQKRRLVLILDLAVNLGLLIFFKYFEFLLTTLEAMGFVPPWNRLFSLPEIVYPVGLSFFTFQGLSLAIDQYRSPDTKAPSLLDTMVFVSFFPTVLSGPIQRYQTFHSQVTYSKPAPESVNLGLTLILSGLFKKVALSGYLSEHIVRGVFQVPDSYSALGVLGGIYGYSAQIYLDFSGYSDLAQGTALLLGVEVGRNFMAPYLTTNIRDFWRQWHISLSTWLRDYLYIPLGGSRRGSKTLNLILTQTLGGLWHGAHLRYLIWGLGHGLALAATHLFLDRKNKKLAAWAELGLKHWQLPRSRYKSLKKFGGFLLTVNFVSFMWILFRAENMDRALEIARAALNFTRPGQGAPIMVWLMVLLTLGIQAWGLRIRQVFIKFQSRLGVPLLALWCALWVILIIKLGPDGVLPFIYFQY